MAKKSKEPVTEEITSVKGETFDSLIKQVDVEYNLAWQHQIPKIQVALSRLKLYNNQKKDVNAVGDPLLFTVLQTILASLYDDKLGVEFTGREEGDAETGENLTALADFDYDKMQKDKLDYDWLWDTCFFGHSLVKMAEFDRDPEFMCPIPELMDPMTFLRDPKAITVNGDIRGRGAMRFGGREIWVPRRSLSEAKGYFDIKDIKSADTEVKELVKQAKEARDAAQGLGSETKTDKIFGDNEAISALEWYTWWRGKRVMVTLANDRKTVIKFKELKKYFPIVDRQLYPTSHDWDGVSIPDIIEDKQRQRSVAINLTLQAMKADLYPMYIYDESRIKNKSDLLEFQFNKFVGVKGDGDIRGAVQPMNKATPRMDLVDFILNTLDSSAQRATATPEMQQGQVSDSKRTLGELNLVAQKVDTRYSLTAKVFGWSEQDFWQQWYMHYKENFKSGIDEKMIRIVGAMGTKWRGLTRENIIGVQDPDIKIESRVVTENRKLKERVMLTAYGNMIGQDPSANKREFMKKLGKLNGLSKDEINSIYPPTYDELLAEDENEKLNEDKLVIPNPDDNDQIHLTMHNKAKDGRAKTAHVEAHKASMLIKRQQPELFSPESKMLNPNPAEPVPTQPMSSAANLSPSLTA
jgi:hypothetical protein